MTHSSERVIWAWVGFPNAQPLNFGADPVLAAN